MHRTTIMFPEDLKIKVEEYSRRKGLSMGEIVREAVKDLLARQNEDQKDSFFSDNTIYKGDTPKELSADHDKYLYGDPS